VAYKGLLICVTRNYVPKTLPRAIEVDDTIQRLDKVLRT